MVRLETLYHQNLEHPYAPEYDHLKLKLAPKNNHRGYMAPGKPSKPAPKPPVKK